MNAASNYLPPFTDLNFSINSRLNPLKNTPDKEGVVALFNAQVQPPLATSFSPLDRHTIVAEWTPSKTQELDLSHDDSCTSIRASEVKSHSEEDLCLLGNQEDASGSASSGILGNFFDFFYRTSS